MKAHSTLMRGRSKTFLQCASLLFVFVSIAARGEADSSSPSVTELKKLSFEQLLEMEVTSVSKRPERLMDAASAIQVITGDDIRRSGASSIPEALRLASNLQVAQKNSHEWVISARGFSSDVGNKLLVLMDGRTVYTPLFSGVFWDRQNYLLEDIDRIEVISGPGGTLWGANAVNGVINITTKSAKETQGFYAEAGGGSLLEDFVGARYGGMLSSNVSFRIYGKYFDRGEEVFASGRGASDSWQMGQGGFRIDAEPSSGNRFTLQGDGYGAEERITTGGEAHVDGGNILGRWSHVFSDESDMSLQFYYDQTRLSLPTPPIEPTPGFILAPAGVLKDNLDTFDIDFQHRFILGERNRFVWGFGYRFTHDEVKDSPGLGFSPAKLSQDLFSGFIQDEITVVQDRLKLTLGTKLEHNEYTQFEVEPSGRLQWNVTDHQMIWGAVSRAVRMPSRIDRHISQPASSSPLVILEGGSRFDSETVIAYELGYRAQMAERVAGSLSLFYNDYDDIRSTSPARNPTLPGLPFPFFFDNNLEAETYGFELSVSYQLCDWWQLRGGYNLLEEDVRIKSGRVDFNNALNETADPEQQFSLRSSLNFSRHFEFDAGLRWVDTLHVNNSGVARTVPSYFSLDARLAWRPTDKIEVSVVGQNLLDNQHPEFGAPGPMRVEITRSVFGKVTCRF